MFSDGLGCAVEEHRGMIEYQIQPNTRRCAQSGRELQPGEKVYSVLLEADGKWVRQDYSSEAWQGPPHGSFSFWAGRIPPGEQNQRTPIDDDLLLDCLERLEGEKEPARVNFRYVVALLLMRRKRLRFEEARTEGAQEVLVLRCVRTRNTHRVRNPQLSEEEMAAVQDEVFRVLGWQ
jgi:hypothetical protein